MARLLLVFPSTADDTEVPVNLGLLAHAVTSAIGVDAAISAAAQADIVMVDARADLAAAKALCALFRDHSESVPLLLLVPSSALGLIAPSWGMADFVLDSAQPAELDSRLRFLLTTVPTSNTLTGGPVVIDEDAYTVMLDNKPLDLTYTEFELLKYLVLHPGRVLTREHLLSEVWGYDYFGGTRTVDVHIRRLRAKLGSEHDSCIGTVRNVGYRFTAK